MTIRIASAYIVLLLLSSSVYAAPSNLRNDPQKNFNYAVGKWALKQSFCNSQQGAETTLYITKSGIERYESSCKIKDIAGPDIGPWTVSLQCKGEGENFADKLIVDVDFRTLVLKSFGNKALIGRFVYCR